MKAKLCYRKLGHFDILSIIWVVQPTSNQTVHCLLLQYTYLSRKHNYKDKSATIIWNNVCTKLTRYKH